MVKKNLLFALILCACGDISDTCLEQGGHKICYYQKELDEAKARQVGDFLVQHYSSPVSTKLNHHGDIIIVQVEVNTSLAADKQRSFLSEMAQGLSDTCFEGAKVRAVGVDDLDTTVKGSVFGESK